MSIGGLDMIIVVAHIDPDTPPEINQIHKAIRNIHPTIPIAFLTGHRHLRRFLWLDDNAFAIESGRYFETLGLVQFQLVGGKFANFTYKWVDTSLDNFYKLAETPAAKFLTPEGQAVKNMITTYYNQLGLNATIGCSPATYSPYVTPTTPNSLYNLYINEMIPQTIIVPTNATGLYACNAFTLRDFLYKGRVTKNDIFSIMPFGDVYWYFPSTQGDITRAFLESVSQTGKMYYSNITVVTSQKYDIIASAYDIEGIGSVLQKLFPKTPFTKQLYPTSHQSTYALQKWISTNWPC